MKGYGGSQSCLAPLYNENRDEFHRSETSAFILGTISAHLITVLVSYNVAFRNKSLRDSFDSAPRHSISRTLHALSLQLNCSPITQPPWCVRLL